MSLGSLLAGNDPALSPGAEAVVSVAVATLWTSPQKVREIDDPAVCVPARPRDWVESMSAAERDHYWAELERRLHAYVQGNGHCVLPGEALLGVGTK